MQIQSAVNKILAVNMKVGLLVAPPDINIRHKLCAMSRSETKTPLKRSFDFKF